MVTVVEKESENGVEGLHKYARELVVLSPSGGRRWEDEQMAELEKVTEGKLRDRVRGLGGLCLKLECPGYTGAPDRMILLPGEKIIFVETKQRGKKERARQLLVQRQFRDLGFTVFSTVDRPERLAAVIAACEEAMT